MRKKFKRSYIILIVLLLVLTGLSKGVTMRLRGAVVAVMAPMWEWVGGIFPLAKGRRGGDPRLIQELQLLQLENHRLKSALDYLQQWQEEDKLFADLHAHAIPAKVIFRSPTAWSSALWINVGSHDHPSLVKNSPVIVGNSVVGLVDYVGKKQSRIRLITDSGLIPSVRAARGGERAGRIATEIDQLLDSIYTHHTLFEGGDDVGILIDHLERTREGLSGSHKTWLLAKGELQGSREHAKRSRGQLLHGVGFNYDFADAAGPARDLRTGYPIGDRSVPIMPLLEKYDLLVTTGMDGVFPEGLHVAEVTHVYPLQEGDYYYEIEARPTAGDLDELSLVFIIPPEGYNPSDQPPLFGV